MIDRKRKRVRERDRGSGGGGEKRWKERSWQRFGPRSILTGSEFLDNPETDSTKICCQPQDTVVLFWFRFNLYSVLVHEILTVFIVRVCGPFNSFS